MEEACKRKEEASERTTKSQHELVPLICDSPLEELKEPCISDCA